MVLGYLEQLDVVYADGEAMLLLRASVRYVDELRQAVGVMPITAQRQTSDTSVSQANAVQPHMTQNPTGTCINRTIALKTVL